MLINPSKITACAAKVVIVIGKVKLTSDGMPLSEEFKIEAFKRGLRAVEIPVPFHARVGEVKLNTWEDGIWNLWFLVTKMRDF